jgi:hypothetical protein
VGSQPTVHSATVTVGVGLSNMNKALCFFIAGYIQMVHTYLGAAECVHRDLCVVRDKKKKHIRVSVILSVTKN